MVHKRHPTRCTRLEERTTQALVYHGPGQRQWETVPDPTVQAPSDAIVRIDETTICGTDLHILHGDVPTVEAVGDGVGSFRPGDKVLISCITSCGRCAPCKRGMYSHCANGGGWVLGHLIDGTQAEYVRLPYADNSLYAVPQGADEEALVMLSDILPTAYECGVLNGAVKPGDSVAIVGVGPVGLAAVITAQLYSPARIIAVDVDANRLAVAARLGATDTVDSSDGSAVERITELTAGQGVEVAIEAVGIPATFDICQRVVAAGGHVANIGVHGAPVSFEIERLWAHNITLTTRLVAAETTPTLLTMVQAGRLPAHELVTHRFRLGEMMAAYDTFGNAAREQALKVLLARG